MSTTEQMLISTASACVAQDGGEISPINSQLSGKLLGFRHKKANGTVRYILQKTAIVAYVKRDDEVINIG